MTFVYFRRCHKRLLLSQVYVCWFWERRRPSSSVLHSPVVALHALPSGTYLTCPFGGDWAAVDEVQRHSTCVNLTDKATCTILGSGQGKMRYGLHDEIHLHRGRGKVTARLHRGEFLDVILAVEILLISSRRPSLVYPPRRRSRHLA